MFSLNYRDDTQSMTRFPSKRDLEEIKGSIGLLIPEKIETLIEQ